MAEPKPQFNNSSRENLKSVESFIEEYKKIVKDDESSRVSLDWRKDTGEDMFEYHEIQISFKNGKWFKHETSGDSRLTFSNMDRDEKNIVETNEDEVSKIIKEKQKEGYGLSITR